MKATLEFNLPEETLEFKYASAGSEIAASVFEFDQWLRGEVKYKELPEAVANAYDEARTKLREHLGSNSDLVFEN